MRQAILDRKVADNTLAKELENTTPIQSRIEPNVPHQAPYGHAPRAADHTCREATFPRKFYS